MSAAQIPAGDRALLCEVLSWARAYGWTQECSRNSCEQFEQDWSSPSGGGPNVVLYRREFDDGRDMRVYFFDGTHRQVEVRNTSVREAVDVLVAVGVLPQRFSSAHTAGEQVMVASVMDNVVRPTVDDYRLTKQAVVNDPGEQAHLAGWLAGVAETVNDVCDSIGVARPQWEVAPDV